jgi:hypothetical protein
VLEIAPAADFDPAAELRALAARLIAAHKEDPGNAMLGRELRATLQALGAGSAGVDPVLAEVRAMFPDGGW